MLRHINKEILRRGGLLQGRSNSSVNPTRGTEHRRPHTRRLTVMCKRVSRAAPLALLYVVAWAASLASGEGHPPAAPRDAPLLPPPQRAAAAVAPDARMRNTTCYRRVCSRAARHALTNNCTYTRLIVIHVCRCPKARGMRHHPIPSVPNKGARCLAASAAPITAKEARLTRRCSLVRGSRRLQVVDGCAIARRRGV